MSDSNKNSTPHIKLYIPGPTEVSPDILAAQSQWMIGHRMPECAELIGRIEARLQKVFRTSQRVFIVASSGTGLWEAAIRNCARQRVLNCVNGAFSERWAEVTSANGKESDILAAEWGQPIQPEMVAERLAGGGYDAITIVHNETSTGVENPLEAIAQAVRAAPNGEDIMILVDSVSGLSGARLETDAWDLDVVLTASQKAFALPAGLAFAAVSDRAMARAQTVPNRGYYFDFLTLEKSLLKNQTPATPAVSLLFALDLQLEKMMAEGMAGRWARHLAMRDMTVAWAEKHGFELLAPAGYRSPTVTCVRNNLGISISALNKFLRERGMIISNGYGSQLKDVSFRLAHMGDFTPADMEELFANIDEFLAQ